MSAIVDSKLYQALAAHKFNGLAALVLLVVGPGSLAYVSLSAQPDNLPATVIVVPQAPLVRAEPGSLRPSSVATEVGARPVVSIGSGSRPTTPATLTRALQTSLAGAACYEGPINGQWTANSKDAMRRFVTAANARLPVEVPDSVLLALLDSNPDLKCSDTATATANRADTPMARVALETPPIAPPALLPSSASPPLISVPDEAPQHLSISGSVAAPSPRNASSAGRTDRLVPAAQDVPDDVIVPPVSIAAVPQTSAPSAKTTGKKARTVSYRSSKSARKKSSAIDDVSRSITKSVNSLQRSLGTLLN